MHLYFHTNTEMALYYIKALLRDGDEHPMSEIYDYVMENCKGHAVMGEPMRATVISSALWRLANTDGSGYCRLRRGVYQMGDPKKTMKETPSLYERAIRIVSRAERELAGSFYVNLDQGMDLKTSIEVRRLAGRCLTSWGRLKQNWQLCSKNLQKKWNVGKTRRLVCPWSCRRWRMYIYPEHLKARAVMWLWQLRDLTVIGVGVLFSVLAAVQTGVIIPALITASYAF